MTAPLDATGEANSFARHVGIKLCQYYQAQYNADFICGIPCNMYGPNDHFDGRHVLSGLLQRFYEAKIKNFSTVDVWGTGKPRREFLYIDDATDICIFLMNNEIKSILTNISTGIDYSIEELAHTIAKITNYGGKLVFDHTKPDGIPMRLLDNARLRQAGYIQQFKSLEDGLKETLDWFMREAK
ncbi:hypothetical protein FACS1894137_14520 [Spirochaetia bacterium]|nr:hypothetical protein FACS1894137_14520 [Spirochaetia bacterium]